MQKHVVALVALAAVFTGLLFSQAFTGSISGIVSDPTGALVGGAEIVVTDVDKNTRFTTLSNATGYFVVAPLPPGNYSVEAQKSGFRRFAMSGFPLSTQ